MIPITKRQGIMGWNFVEQEWITSVIADVK